MYTFITLSLSLFAGLRIEKVWKLQVLQANPIFLSCSQVGQDFRKKIGNTIHLWKGPIGIK